MTPTGIKQVELYGKTYTIKTAKEQWKVNWHTDYGKAALKQVPFFGLVVGADENQGKTWGELTKDVVENVAGGLGKMGKTMKLIGTGVTVKGLVGAFLGIDNQKVINLYNSKYGEDYKWDNLDDAKKAIEELKSQVENDERDNNTKDAEEN